MPVYGFESEDDIKRVIQAARDAERLKRSPVPSGQPRPAVPAIHIVRVTGAVGAGGMYPGKITRYIAEDEAWVDDYDCKILPINGEVLTNGKRYRGEFVSNQAPGDNLGFPVILVGATGSGGDSPCEWEITVVTGAAAAAVSGCAVKFTLTLTTYKLLSDCTVDEIGTSSSDVTLTLPTKTVTVVTSVACVDDEVTGTTDDIKVLDC